MSQSESDSSEVSGETDIRELIAFRFSEQRVEAMVKKIFRAWRGLSVSINSEGSLQFRVRMQKAKGFEGILEYSIKTQLFKQKIALLYSQWIKKKWFQSWVQCAHIQKQERAERVFNLISICQISSHITHRHLDLMKREFFDALQAPKYDTRSIQPSGMAQKVGASQQSLISASRRSQFSCLTQGRRARRLIPITKQIEIPMVIQKQAISLPPDQKNKQILGDNQKMIMRSVSGQLQKPDSGQLQKPDNWQLQKPNSGQLQKRQDLIIKCKLLQLGVVGFGDESSGLLEAYRAKAVDFLKQKAY